MLKGQKKIRQKELKQDKLVTTYFQSKDWFGNPDNKKKVYIGVGIVAILIVAVFFYMSNKKAKNEEAELKLSPVITVYDAGKYQEAINGDAQAGTMGLLQIVNEYGSTNAGNTAKVYLANCYYNLKDYDNALKYFDDYSGNVDMLKASSLSGMGAVYEAKGDLKKAAEYFEKAAKVNKDVVINQENIFYAVRAYNLAGDKDNARRMYDLLKKDYPKSKYLTDVKKFESEFKN